MLRATFLFFLLLPLMAIHARSQGLNWVLVDTMQNAYGMMSNGVSPLAFDPVTGNLALVHRGKTSYSAGSGEIWYNISTDGGVDWNRITSLNGHLPIAGRFPSAIIFPFDVCAAWVSLHPTNFDLTLGCESYYENPIIINDAGYWSNVRVVRDDLTGDIWLAVRHDPTTTTHGSLLHACRIVSRDTVVHFDPWPLDLFRTPGAGFDVGLEYRNGAVYAGGAADFPGDPGEVLNLFYTASTDNGSTWTTPIGPYVGSGDWRDLPPIASSPYDNWEQYMAFDMLVDHDGYVHFWGVVEDTSDGDADLAVVEIYETESGWDAKFVAENLAASTRTDYNTFEQTGYHVSAAMSADGMAMAAFWLSAASPGDTLPDIWASTRHVAGEVWSGPVNLTNTPDYAELLLQVAPVLRSNGGDGYTAFIARAYEQGSTSYPPGDVAATDIFCASVPLTISATGVEPEDQVPQATKLVQNYPNPFNGETRIVYTVGSRLSAVLRVYDVLGREVAALVNEPKDAGTHSVTWDAAGMPSGVYYYRLQAGSYVETRKLVLLR